MSPNVNCYVVRMSTVLNSEVFDHQCISDHQSHLPVRESSSGFSWPWWWLQHGFCQRQCGQQLYSGLHSPGQIMTGFAGLNHLQHQELNFNIKLFDSLINLIGNATRHWKRNILIHIMVFNAGLQWQTVYYGIFECKNNCLRGPFSCLFKTQKMKAYPSLCWNYHQVLDFKW